MQVNYTFYPKLGQLVLEGHFKKAEIERIVNLSTGGELYAAGQPLTIQKVNENGIEKTVIKLNKKNPLLKGMEDDDQISIKLNLSDREATAQKKADSERNKKYRQDVAIARKQEAERIREAKRNHIGYYKADRIKKTGLTSLIKSRWESGQGLFSATGGAMKDKTRAFGVRMKRRMDPLGWVGATAGSIPLVGGFAKWAAVSGLGALFGRDPEKIRYFGGWARDKKDPKRTKLGPGQVRNLETGDSSADILAKLLNFMMKDRELQKKERELDNDFQKEREAEATRRHEKLVEEIRKLHTPKAMDEVNDAKKGIGKTDITDTVLGGFKKIMGVVKGLAFGIGGLMIAMYDVIKGVLGLVPKIGSFLSPLAGFATSIISVLKDFVVGFVERVILQDLISRVFGAFMTLVGRGLGMVGAGAMALMGPIGAILGVAAAGVGVGVGIGAAGDALTNVQREAFTQERPNSPSERLKNLKSKFETDKEHIDEMFGVGGFLKSPNYKFGNDVKARDARAVLAAKYEKDKAELQTAQNVYFNEFIKPKLEAMGYTVEADKFSETGKLKAGDFDLPVIKKDGKEISSLEYDVLAGKMAISKSIRKSGEEAFNKLNTDVQKSLKEVIVPDVKNDLLKQFETLQKNIHIPHMMEDDTDHSGSNPDVVSSVTNNTIGSKATYADATPISQRNKNDTLNLALARTTATV